MGNTYSEQIFQSIDKIISQRLNEVSFDKTEICKIISQDKNDKRKYLVSNGSLKYEAYSDDENRRYSNNQKVYVRITNSDYSLRKIITGSYAADDTNENLYVNPFNHLVTSNTLTLPNSIQAKVNDEEYDDWKDIPIDETKPNFIEFPVEFKYKNIQNFDYIGLDFSFNTNIVGYQGSYALRISLWNGETELTNEDDNTLILSSKNLYGNPYNLNSSLSFQHLFPWPTRKKDNKIEPIPITEITKIKLQLIQDNNFLKQQGEINVNTDTWIELTKADLKFGYDVKNITKDELQLILEEGQSLKYTTGETAAKRNLYLDWKHFDTSNTPYIFNINQSPNIFEYYKVYWLHYVDGLGKNADLPDEYAWNWETITNNTGLTQDIALTTLYRTDQYKAVIKYKYQNNETIYYAESTGLIFENTQVTAQPGATNNSDESLRLSLAKGDTGIYNIYGLDGRMVDTSKKNHTITAAFLDKTSWNDKKIETVIWKFPDSNTMILNGIQDSNNKNKATFDINSYYKPGAMNNRIWCEVKFVTGEIRRGSLTLQFGEISTAGTSYAFNIDFVGHNTCVYANSTDKVKIKATFEKVNGEVMTVPTITWSWVTSDSYKNDDDPLTSGSGIEIKGSGDEIELFYSGTTVPSENYSILQATISNYAIDNGLNSDLTAYLPIPIAYQDYNYISGATRLVYAMDNQSVSKSNDDYRLYQINDKKETIEVENTSWYITSHPSTLDGIPELREITEKIGDKEITRYTIRPVSYTSSYIPLVNINCVIGENIVWSQPILILSNAWESDEINDWNGVVEIDENDGNIKAPFFVAGKKEKVIEDGQPKNRLTGLVIGDLEKASVASGTGIYGFYQGRPRYYLTDSGKFYVGKDNNFISFNEGFDGRSKKDELLIKTNSFILNVNNDWLISSKGISKLQINDTTKNKDYYIYTKGKFGVDTDGTLYANDANISGKVIATEGAVGNWIIKNGKLYSNNTEKGVGFSPWADGQYCIWAGETNGKLGFLGTDAKFLVEGDGKMRASAGTIGGWNIAPEKLWAKNITYGNGTGMAVVTDPNDPAFWAGYTGTGNTPWDTGADWESKTNFYVTSAGYLKSSSGQIGGWSIIDNWIQSAWIHSAPTANEGENSHNGIALGFDQYGNAMIKARRWKKSNGGYTYEDTFTVDGTNGNVSITGTINAGSVISNKVQLGTKGYTAMSDHEDENVGSGTTWSRGGISYDDFYTQKYNGGYILLTSDRLVMGACDTTTTALIAVKTDGKIGVMGVNESGNTQISDKTLKHSISALEFNYEQLFDNLLPVKYKYNEGSSDRYHTGFISQDVENALSIANLTAQDFGGFVIHNKNQEKEIYALRYEEFIALNTWQIQKLKTRVTELEQEIKELKQNEI